MISSSGRKGLIGAAAALLGVSAVVQAQIDRPDMRRQAAIEPPTAGRALSGGIGKAGFALPFEYSLGAISGFRQVIAGLLWVRADSFFHQGNYDAILPLVRVITWMDPNFLDVYATGAWHLTYNFTDEQQRSDRRYLPAGGALLNEAIRNNPDLFDMYKEAGWLNFDKIKNFDEAVRYYEQGLTKEGVDYTQVGHALAHALERAGRIDDSIRMWERMVAAHKKEMDDPKTSEDKKGRAKMGYESAVKNLNLMKIRRVARPYDTKNPVDAGFKVKVERIKPKVFQVSGEWNLVGAKNFDEKIWGPVDGARVDVRLQDAGYKMPAPTEFSFDVDPKLTIMQDQLSVRGGKQVKPGGLYLVGSGYSTPPLADKQGLYSFDARDVPAGLGLPLGRALKSNVPLSPEGKRALENLAQMPLAQLKGDAAKIAEMEKMGLHVALKDHFRKGTFTREIDMSKDPKMYSFAKDKYDLIVSFNPRNAPEFVQDRYGWSGEGLTDKNFLVTDEKGLRMLRVVIPLTREDLLGDGRKVLAQRG